MLPVQDVAQLIFNGEFVLLKDDVDPKRRALALNRLQCYVGKAPGCESIAALAKARTTERLSNKSLLGPYKGEIEQKLANTQRYADGIRQLFAKYKLDTPDGKAALDALDSQLKDYDAWVRSTVMPRTRADFRLPEPLYAYNLKQVGIDIPPQELIKQAELEFVELRQAMPLWPPRCQASIQSTRFQSCSAATRRSDTRCRFRRKTGICARATNFIISSPSGWVDVPPKSWCLVKCPPGRTTTFTMRRRWRAPWWPSTA